MYGLFLALGLVWTGGATLFMIVSDAGPYFIAFNAAMFGYFLGTAYHEWRARRLWGRK